MQGSTWIAIVEAFGVWAAVIVALWGDKIRSWLFQADLQLSLIDPAGVLTMQDHYETGRKIGSAEARYYHVRVINRARYPAAHEVQILLLSVDTVGPSGDLQRQFTGGMPFTWTHAQLYPTARTVGFRTQADADLLYVRDRQLELLLQLTPNNLQTRFNSEAHFFLSLVARGVDGESPVLRLKVDWDGKWERGEAEMRKHLIIQTAR